MKSNILGSCGKLTQSPATDIVPEVSQTGRVRRLYPIPPRWRTLRDAELDWLIEPKPVQFSVRPKIIGMLATTGNDWSMRHNRIFPFHHIVGLRL
jgi:hypothetical protein